MILRSTPHPALYFDGIAAVIVPPLCVVIHYILKALHISKRFLYRQCKKVNEKYNSEETSRIAFLCDTNPFTNIISKEELYPLIELEFEGEKLKFPHDMHNMLTSLYGDYMQLPPVEKRKNQYPYELDFGDGE